MQQLQKSKRKIKNFNEILLGGKSYVSCDFPVNKKIYLAVLKVVCCIKFQESVAIHIGGYPHLFAKFLLGRINSQILIYNYLLFLASTAGVPWVHFWLPASIEEMFRLVKVFLPQAFWAWVGAAHISDKKAHKWSYFILWANKCVGEWVSGHGDPAVTFPQAERLPLLAPSVAVWQNWFGL